MDVTLSSEGARLLLHEVNRIRKTKTNNNLIFMPLVPFRMLHPTNKAFPALEVVVGWTRGFKAPKN